MESKPLEKLREQLLASSTWPLKYMFKFIVPNVNGKVDAITAIMPNQEQITFKHTKNLKFVSITCIAKMQSVDEIIDITAKATSYKGVIAL